MAYTKYSLTPANNTAAPPDGAPEGMLPSAVNDTMRDMMAQIRDCGDGIRGGTYTMTAPVITGGSINGTTIGATTASTGKFSTLTNAALTSGRVTYAGTSGVLQDDADFTFNGTTVTMANDASISGLTVGKGGGAGSFNTALGYQAFNSGSNSNNGQVAIGYQAMYANTTGYGVAVGYLSLTANTTGTSNVAVGHESLRSNTTASGNTAVGYQAGYSNVTGSITAIGYQALYNNTTTLNTAVGYRALYTNTSGQAVTAVGYEALLANTTGSRNTAVGYGSLTANTTGENNTAVGQTALGSTTTGTNNSALGYDALQANTTGQRNVAVGKDALKTNTTGEYNTAVGYQALLNMSGSNLHTAVGYLAGSTSTNGSGCTLIGSYAQPSSASGDYQLVVCTTGGSNVLGKGNSTGFIDPNGGGVFQGNNSSSWSTTSDQRLKKNIIDNNEGLDKITAIKVRNFEYRLPDEVTDLPQEQAINKAGVQLGVIAQELQAVCPDCVTEQSTGVLSINTDELFWHLVNAVKELKAEIDQIKGTK